MQLPKSIEPALVSRIKILSSLKIDEHRIPQDGQFTVKVAGKEVDLRIAISPVVWGEQVVIRLLDKTGNSFDIEQMGLCRTSTSCYPERDPSSEWHGSYFRANRVW